MSKKSSDDEQIPMADDDEDVNVSCDLQPQETAGVTSLPVLESVTPKTEEPRAPTLLDNELSPEEQEEKARLIAQVLELQNTLDDLSSRVDNVKEENLRLRSENQVLGQYIGKPAWINTSLFIHKQCLISENLMAASNVFQPANDQPKTGKRK